MTTPQEEPGGTPWSRGGKYVYGDDELYEGLYALEDEAVRLEDGKYIPYARMQDVMLLYRERLQKHIEKLLSQERTRLKEEIEKERKTGMNGEGLPFENSPDIYGNARIEAYKKGFNEALDAALSKLTN